MTALLRPLREAATYRSLLFLTTALPLGVLGVTLLLTGWGLAVGFLLTPAVPAVLIGVRWLVGGIGTWESLLARELLGVETAPQRLSSGGRGYWARGKAALADASFWRQQAYLLLRFLLGGPIAIAVSSLVGSSLYVIALPLYYRWTQSGNSLQIDTLQKALLVMPLGVIGLILSLHVIRPLAALWRAIAGALLAPAGGVHVSRRRALRLHALASVVAAAICIVVWLPIGGTFWPVWPLLGLSLPPAIHASIVYARERQDVVRRYGLTTAAVANVGISASLEVFYVLVWAASGGGYFWPIWSMLAFAAIPIAHVLVARSRRSSRERIETLETTRAGAVDVQETELRRIERDLHDGAQARLVALGMNLGMAEQKLAADPAAARELVSEARAGIEEALRELRDLARGIHPPVLTDRGLEAAIGALADRSAIPVTVSADVPDRPAAAVETAAYFVAAEALTNAAKHAGASRVEVRIVRRPKSLVLEVSDDGRGGADPAGSGLSGLRRRIEALDGTLLVVSPADGGTTLRAELPCAS